MYPSIDIFGIQIGTYGLMSIIGMIVATFVAACLSKRYNVSVYDVILIALSAIAGLVVGGHLLYGLTNIRHIFTAISGIGTLPFADVIKYIGIAFGGMVYYGGLFGCLAAVLIHTKCSNSMNRQDMFDVFAAVIPLFHTFGRIGCFLGGCCYGIEAEWGFTVHENAVNPDIVGVQRLPIQLIEALCNILIFSLIFGLWKKNVLRGKLIFVYLSVYAVIRFALEFFRGDEIRGIWFGLSTSQWLSICIIAALTLRFIIKSNNKRREANNGTYRS